MDGLRNYTKSEKDKHHEMTDVKPNKNDTIELTK